MRSEAENPWQRLPWTLASALLAWLILMWAFGEFLSRPENIRPQQKPIDAKLIEIPPSPKPPSPKTESKPESMKAPVKRSKPIAKPLPKVEEPRALPKAEPPPKAEAEAPRKAESRSSPPQKGVPGGDMMGARAIYSPKPVIPDEFRQDAMDMLVVARFHIASDGTVKVELIAATPIPGLNRAVLDTLDTWKFFPALKDGKPVASTQDVRFRLQVK